MPCKEAARVGRAYPLVLLDDGLPDEDGFSLAARVQAHPTLSPKILMMLTSGDNRGEQARCEGMQLSGWLMKPIKQSDLFDAIVTALGHQPLSRPVEKIAGSSPRRPICVARSCWPKTI